MDPVLRASLATLAALAVLGGLAALARPQPERRLERIGLLLHHGVALGVAIAAGLCAMLGGGDGRPLLLCAAGPLLVLSLQDVVSARTALWSVPLVASGLVVQALILLELLPVSFAPPVCAIAGIACTAGTVACVLRRRHIVVPRARAVIAGQATALGLVALSGFTAAIPGTAGAGTWAIAVGAAGTVATAGRLTPASPPGVRELFASFLTFALVLVASAAASLDVGMSFLLAAGVSLASLASFTLVRATFEVARTTLPRVAPSSSSSSTSSDDSEGRRTVSELELPSAQALAAMSPLLDDALLRRPGRPRVIARVPARRLLDAALEKARSAQPSTKGRREDLLRVEVLAAETDIDVDGDPADLSEALCAVLDNALRARALHPDVKVQVQLRGSAAAVTFEISDMVPEGAEGAEPLAAMGIPDTEAPFLNPRVDPDRPGLGVSLARARLLVERNGGKLLTRSSAEGSFVQVTMPRRMQKGAVGQA